MWTKKTFSGRFFPFFTKKSDTDPVQDSVPEAVDYGQT